MGGTQPCLLKVGILLMVLNRKAMVSQHRWAAFMFLAGLVLMPMGLYCFIVWKLYSLPAVGI
ncbi:hypothetical protein N836_19240 [Leptolyngbya sp. Heron Island J]|nr:hypothetical protein N836_19240 [Leptolyngbya sp. Heron Island J]